MHEYIDSLSILAENHTGCTPHVSCIQKVPERVCYEDDEKPTKWAKVERSRCHYFSRASAAYPSKKTQFPILRSSTRAYQIIYNENNILVRIHH